MSARADLTRWNRAGLSRFRYVDGNAVEYLEILRQQLAKRFGCDLRLTLASDSNTESEIIDDFRSEFQGKKDELAFLVVRAKDHLEKWTIAGFSDAGEFRSVVIDHSVVIDDSSLEFSNELKKEPVDEARIIELAASSLGRAYPKAGESTWLTPLVKIPMSEREPETETLIQRQERLNRRQQRILDSYHQDRRDWAWEISRTFARACHVLTEYTDAYANEGYLGTATQWNHVRRLVEMLDYHPAPPASATTQLAFIAKESKAGKENRTGLVGRGFQVKHSPENGGAKVIFETLEDLIIDPALNALRPKGWDQSDEPAVPPGNNGSEQALDEERQFSVIADRPVIDIRGVGQVSATKLDTLKIAGGFQIKHFLDLDPDNADLDIDTDLLWKWKAKANILVDFAPTGNWTVIGEWQLPDIAAASAESLAELSGNSRESADALKLDVEIIAICLDQPLYESTRLKELFAPAKPVAGTVATSWYAQRKPEVVPGEVAMAMDRSNNFAEAVTIDGVDKNSADETILHIDLLPSPVQYSWKAWPRGKTTLRCSPRWEKKCWLNGTNVIRTREPHGFSASEPDGPTPDTFVCWKIGNAWKFAKVIEVDKRNLRLDLSGSLPGLNTELFEASPITSSTMSADLEAIGMAVGELPEIVSLGFGDSVGPGTPGIEQPFKINPPEPGGPPPDILAPPGGLSFGSFLFPTPMLPMDLVKAAVDLMLSMGVMVIPSTGEVVFKSLPDIAMPTASELLAVLDVLPNIEWDPAYGTDALKIQALETMLTSLPEPPPGDPRVQYKEILAELEKANPLIAISADALKKADVDTVVPRYVVEGNASKISGGDWVVGEFSDGLRALRAGAITEYVDDDKAERFSLSFENLTGSVGELRKIHADFRGELVAEGAAVNITPVDPEDIELEVVPESLKVGDDVLLTAEDKEPVAARIESIKGNSITTNPPATGFRKGNLVILGNVVVAGHGEGKPEKILGSGDAAKSNQEFTLEVDQVSFTPDATKNSGVAAAIDVNVAGRIWEQVSTLKDSTPGDHHYAVQMTEDGYPKIIFGDGDHGRRLPSGRNNVRVRCRVGSGLAGNVPARALEKPVNPHPLIETVMQPLLAAGGGDMEDVASLRENAPPTLLALERAVSLSDFAHLAAAQSSVWQATAYSQILHGGRTASVVVVIVPAGGVQSVEIRKAVRAFLQKHALPGVQVSVETFVEVRFSVSITVRVRTDAYVAEEVEKAVAAAVVEHFTLQNRKLGAHLYLSEVYKIVEGIQGVENSICVLSDDASLQLVRAGSASSVVYLDTDSDENPSKLAVNSEEYRP